ncbi:MULTISPECIES: hypothetical protein [Aquimarina]|uniref:hypothetical protein n=1 Tax=Aquimarina TaxID=290174 RepID=UPI0013149ACD|nr:MULTISPECIES: hypothetical protein [Aquimarina]
MKKTIKKLELKKVTISQLEANAVKGGGTGPTAIMCNSVPRHLGGIGCHMF